MSDHRPRSAVQSLCAVLLAISLMVVPLAVVRPAYAVDVGHVLEAVGLLREYYVDRLDVITLLNGALAGVRSALSNAGVQTDTPEIPAGTQATQAEALFRTRFDAAIAAAGGRVSRDALAQAAIRAMTTQLQDSHVYYLSPDSYQEYQRRQRGQVAFSGIGVVLIPREGRFYVRDVVPGGPAAAAGVQQFDRIARIDNTPTGGLQADQLSGLIRGPSGTSVTLVLERPGHADPVSLTVTRAPIQVPTVFQARVIDGGIGYLQFYQFGARSGAEFRGALERMLAGGMRAMVLDLRGNLGGFVNELETITSLLLPPGRTIYQEVARGGQARAVRTAGVPVMPQQQPIIVLVDEASASAAELLAAALQENGRAVLVGQKTMGAVEAAIMVGLSDGSGMSVTVRRLSSSQGHRLEGNGVVPEIAVELSIADMDQGRDSQFQAALQLARQRLGTAARLDAVAGR